MDDSNFGMDDSNFGELFFSPSNKIYFAQFTDFYQWIIARIKNLTSTRFRKWLVGTGHLSVQSCRKG